MADEQTMNQSDKADAAVEQADAAITGLVEGAGAELRDQVYSEENPLGPFKAPESVEVAGIRENVGYVPRWLIYIFVMAILLALTMWIRTGGPLS